MIKKILLVVLLGVNLSGCFLAPAIDSFKKVGVTSNDRRQLFAQRIKLYTEALFFGDKQQALAFATPEGRAELSKQLKAGSEEEKVVESKIDSVEFDESAHTADAEVVVKYFVAPFYIVNKRIEKQNWVFTVMNGWQLSSREVVKAG